MTDREPLAGQVIETETEREAESGTDIRKLTEIGRQAEIEIKTEIETDTNTGIRTIGAGDTEGGCAEFETVCLFYCYLRLRQCLDFIC